MLPDVPFGIKYKCSAFVELTRAGILIRARHMNEQVITTMGKALNWCALALFYLVSLLCIQYTWRVWDFSCSVVYFRVAFGIDVCSHFPCKISSWRCPYFAWSSLCMDHIASRRLISMKQKDDHQVWRMHSRAHRFFVSRWKGAHELILIFVHSKDDKFALAGASVSLSCHLLMCLEMISRL